MIEFIALKSEIISERPSVVSPSPGDLPNPGLPHCRRILYWLSHQGSPRILEWVAKPFSLWPHGQYSQRNSPGQNIGVGRLSLLQGIFPPRDRTQSPTVQADSLPAEPPRKPNTGVGSLTLLQWLFLTQEQN